MPTRGRQLTSGGEPLSPLIMRHVQSSNQTTYLSHAKQDLVRTSIPQHTTASPFLSSPAKLFSSSLKNSDIDNCINELYKTKLFQFSETHSGNNNFTAPLNLENNEKSIKVFIKMLQNRCKNIIKTRSNKVKYFWRSPSPVNEQQDYQQQIGEQFIASCEKDLSISQATRTKFHRLIYSAEKKFIETHDQSIVVPPAQQKKFVSLIRKRCVTELYSSEQPGSENFRKERVKPDLYGLNKNDIYSFWRTKQKILHPEQNSRTNDCKPISLKSESAINPNKFLKKMGLKKGLSKKDYIQEFLRRFA